LARTLYTMLLSGLPGDGKHHDVMVEHLLDLAESRLKADGWVDHYRLGFVHEGRDLSFYVDPEDHEIVVQRRSYGMWLGSGDRYRYRSMAQAANLLGALELIDPRYTTAGADALLTHALVCERAADEIVERVGGREDHEDWAWALNKASGLREAATTARSLYPLRAPQ